MGGFNGNTHPKDQLIGLRENFFGHLEKIRFASFNGGWQEGGHAFGDVETARVVVDTRVARDVGVADQGTDAQAEVTVRLEENGKTVTGRAADTDTLVASAKAYLNALNKLLVKRQKTAPEAISAAN